MQFRRKALYTNREIFKSNDNRGAVIKIAIFKEREGGKGVQNKLYFLLHFV